MLASTRYPEYLDPIDGEHESQPHPAIHALQKCAHYCGEVLALIFVTAFTSMELLFVIVLVALMLQASGILGSLADFNFVSGEMPQISLE